MVPVMYQFRQKKSWATFWATFSQIHLVTLIAIEAEPFFPFITAGKKVVFFHRNPRTRRRMYLCMLDNQIGQKFMGFAPADMARLPHLINTSLSAGTTPTLNLSCFTREVVHF
jgi:hypothetical protein